MFSINWILGLIPSWVPWAIIGFGVALFVLVHLFKGFIPILYRFVAVIVIELVAIALFAAGFYIDGRRDVLVDAKEKIDQAVADQKDITKQAIEEYKNTIVATKAKNETIIKYINTKDNNLCQLPDSFIRLHNYAAKDSIPNTAGTVNVTGTGITNSTRK
jgi:hypothetical protein